jgi:ubiquinone/menaquinone biosynthesis C-methylase UbiE
MSERIESWHSASYAASWAGEDVIANMLELPRRISAALVADAGIAVEHAIDLGSGPGVYLELFLDAFPGARGTWVDSSEAMLELARKELDRFGDRVAYVIHDVEHLETAELAPAQVVTSSRTLHHFSPESLAHVYRTVFDVVVPGGFAVNLDHVGAPGDWEDVYRRVRAQFTGDRKQKLAAHRHDYPLAPTEVHLGSLRDAGFESPDAPWRTFYTALMVARKPA